jgi:sugar phosphate isomerase/epimerase
MSTVKVGCSLYSLQLEYMQCLWSFDDTMQLCSMIGDKGVEIVGPMHHRCWPDLSYEFERLFKSGCEKWGLIPTQYGAYSEMCVYIDLDERYDFLLRQMKTAKKLGFPICRVQTPGVDPILERLALAAEKMKIKIATEITAGDNLMNPEGTFIETTRKIDSEWVGFNPDTNMFEDRSLEVGNDKKPAPRPAAPGMPERKPGTAADYNRLKDVMKYIMHMHGKFHWAANGDIPAVPFDKIMEVLVNGGFNGYVSCEFEDGTLGQYNNSFEVVQVFEKVCKNGIAKYSK